MDRQQCKQKFYGLVHPSHPNEWEVDEVMLKLARLDTDYQHLLFEQIPAIWPISHSLCLTFLEEAAPLSSAVPPHLVPEWVRTILRRYETDGLAGARSVITDVRGAFLEPLESQNRVDFEEISARMGLYVRGLSGLPLELRVAEIPCTDTRVIEVMGSLALFPAARQNMLWYKFLISVHYAFLRLGTYRLQPSDSDLLLVREYYDISAGSDQDDTPAAFFDLFPHPGLAEDLFFVMELQRAMLWLETELPGLCLQLQGLEPDLERIAAERGEDGAAARLSRCILQILFGTETREHGPEQPGGPVTGTLEPGHPLFQELFQHYTRFGQTDADYRRPWLLDLLGRHDFERAKGEIEKHRAEVKSTFVLQLAELLEEYRGVEETLQDTDGGTDSSQDQAVLMLTENGAENDERERSLVIDNESCEIPDELLELINEIERDLGEVPQSYFSAAAGISGGGISRDGGGEAAPVNGGVNGAIYFDEWDHRRNGYRQDWCHVIEKEIPLLRSNFVPATLEKHRGLLTRIKRQFEMMRLTQHFVRRQREGDDFDLDAVVEARGDHKGGTVATDRLFIRLLKDERDIVTLFLVDMSSSTEGWVGSVIKEALVLLCEAMEVVGDSYGIYGFSGMRRTRCEIFPLKHPAEPFSSSVPEKIGSIMPREYTRLGPAIRYASHLLGQCEARMRLLVTITDGKPEDYDDYKGDYAIEDTRKALLEARGDGLKTFCITVDRAAHDYLPHMYGRGNYVFVDDIQQLPFRLIDMYRMLTA